MSEIGHHETSPSNFPKYEKCLHYESGEVGEAAKSGTRQHQFLEMLFSFVKESGERGVSKKAEEWAMENLSNDERGYVMWAYWRILKILDEHGVKLSDIEVEQQIVAYTEEMDAVDGTGDILFDVPEQNLSVVIDYKSGQKYDYSGQYKVYGYGRAQETGMKYVRTYGVYGKLKDIDRKDYTTDKCGEYFNDLVHKIKNKDEIDACPNEYCNWCKKELTCKARQEMALSAKKVVDHPLKGITSRTDLSKLSPEKMGSLYEFSIQLEKWCKSVKKAVEEKLKREEDVTGFELVTGQTNVLPSQVEIYDLLEEEGLMHGEIMAVFSSSQKALKDALGNEKFKEQIIPKLTKKDGNPSVKKVK